MRRLLFDLEGDGLLPELTNIHCLAAVDPDTGETFDYGPEQIGRGIDLLSKADVLYAHNGLRYDYPALERVCGFSVHEEKRGDTFIISRLMHPNLRDTDGRLVESGRLPKEMHGKHSIEAWGHRLGCQKGAFKGPWDRWSPEMHQYMVQDVNVLMKLWKHLNIDAYSKEAIKLEHRIARLTDLMEAEGWPFDQEAAAELHVELLARQNSLLKELVAEFGSWYEPKKRDEHGVAVAFTPKKDNKRIGYIAGAPCTQIERVVFNPGSRRHIIRCLKLRGWKPTEFTKSGQPKLDDIVLEKTADTWPATSKLVEYLLIDKRIGQLANGDNAWLKLVGSDGRMHGGYNPMGTTTSRAAHFRPNLGQVPAAKRPYGKECRALFTVPDGWKLVGADQASLQLRNLGHYLAPFDGGVYGEAVATGDPHWRACSAMGLIDPDVARDPANGLHEILREAGGKRATYATVFGCHDNKFGSIIREACLLARNKNPDWGHVYERFFARGESDRKVGEEWRAAFYDQLGLAPLIDKLARIMQRNHHWRGSIPGLDGRWVPCRSEHSALNYLLQSAEGVICKRWICDAYDELIARGLKHGWEGDFVFCAWVHDEVQVAARDGIEDTVADVLVTCGERAGVHYGFRVKLSSKAKIGRTWADTH